MSIDDERGASATATQQDGSTLLREAIEAQQASDFEALTAALKKAGLDLGPDPDLGTLLELVGVLLGDDRREASDSEEIDLGRFGLRLGSGIGHIPNDLVLVGRAIGLIDGINRQLAPDLDAVEIVARYARDA